MLRVGGPKNMPVAPCSHNHSPLKENLIVIRKGDYLFIMVTTNSYGD